MSSVIQVRNVTRSFSSAKKEEGWKGSLGLLFKPQMVSHQALKGVSFELEEGSFNGLIGANGAGKTTLLKILSGLIPASSGEARVLGLDPFKRTQEFRRSVSLVMGQKAQLWWDLPAVDAFDLLRAIYEIEPRVYRDRLHTLAELLDVKRHLNTQIRRLSLGERMKMELIGAILHWPKVIFLDEPTIGLDVLAAHKLREFLRVFNEKEKATIILTSHNMDDIERLCTRVLILRSGEMIFDGKPEGLVQAGEQRLRVRFLQMPDRATLSRMSGVPETSIETHATLNEGSADDAEVPAENGESRLAYFSLKREQIVPTLQKLMNALQIVDMGIEEQSLENVIQRLYSDDKATYGGEGSRGEVTLK